MQESNIKYRNDQPYQKTDTQDHNIFLNHLKQEIENNPNAKHRIILKAIKTAKSRELQKTVRKFFLKEFWFIVMVCVS